MSDTAVAEKPTTKTKPKGRQLTAWQDFEQQLREREQNIASMLPNHVSRERFINSAIAAVKQTPQLLQASPRSLFSAITKSAQDGLLPDGREGVITVYREKQKDGSYENVAQWNPMAWGLRKRARELDKIVVSTNVVYENDDFLYEEGDDPKIDHKPARLGQPRGEMIGAYAIFRSGDGHILHREVMDAEQIATVRAQSKAPNSLMWTKFTTEGWRKTVLRRGFKSVPCSEELERAIRRDDDLFNFDADGPSAADARPKAAVIQPPTRGEKKELPPIVGQEENGSTDDSVDEAEVEIIDHETGEIAEDGETRLLPPTESAALKAGLLKRLQTCGTTKAVSEWSKNADAALPTMQPEDRAEVEEQRGALLAELFDREQGEGQ